MKGVICRFNHLGWAGEAESSEPRSCFGSKEEMGIVSFDLLKTREGFDLRCSNWHQNGLEPDNGGDVPEDNHGFERTCEWRERGLSASFAHSHLP
jgi:hypothetical protein